MFLICGEALFDFFVDDTESSHSGFSFNAIAGGSPFNVALGLARMKRNAGLLTGLANDFLGDRLYSVLEKEGVTTDYLVRLDAPTTLAMVAPGSDGAPQYAFYGEKAADRSLEDVHLPALAETVSGIHLGSYSLVVEPTAGTLMTLLERESKGRLVSLDPNIRLSIEPDVRRWQDRVEAFAAWAHLIKVSDEDIALLYPERTLEDVARSFLSERCRLVVVTRGGEGALAFTHDHEPIDIKGEPVELIDAVGAGDTFQAALLCWLDEQGMASPEGLAALKASHIEAMLHFCHKAAAVTCSRRGPDLPSRQDIDG
ncbi:carbohydrate kinase family protein [Larsenimonas suaedae]|uniref:Carbohydrate kinase n=1 Tax=Larsenimonas suaedae TaxID=1851019 RepID=A0ABU1GU93_9GAMM|nr:carbohydrate kinase [Larsenimonas suaedae]MCM2972045.1 carbohydrate kinase [Larsenimonas suaedae]MDR5895598.1 carbohydrate kinase [Larsenimonas suaedae]